MKAGPTNPPPPSGGVAHAGRDIEVLLVARQVRCCILAPSLLEYDGFFLIFLPHPKRLSEPLVIDLLHFPKLKLRDFLPPDQMELGSRSNMDQLHQLAPAYSTLSLYHQQRRLALTHRDSGLLSLKTGNSPSNLTAFTASQTTSSCFRANGHARAMGSGTSHNTWP